ncbi:outer membrane usher protein [Serratia proteamaculans]|uniref:Outer membrane usher protein n=1 Tax=Serratia proteamaculans TaxID=28151 RepID=A0A5Q2V7T9_SERPR|nr:outer membrane usher protein [Serratia proteamaculans]QGH61592.1 outer membrane usher protein [Serratia proteamaculans]
MSSFISPHRREARSLRPFARILLPLLLPGSALAADGIEFNTDVLDVKDRSHIDLNQFSRAGYIMPGRYPMVVQVNKHQLPEQSIRFLTPPKDPKASVACLTPETVEQLGLKKAALQRLTWWHDNQCLDASSLPGLEMRGDLGEGALYVNLPQAYLEYTAENWDPPSRWDDGLAGVLFDYNMNAQVTRPQSGNQTQSLSGNGTAGANLGAWRLRADWQAQYNHTTGQSASSEQNWDWSRYYLYRAIAALRAKLTLGEDYLTSGMFDSFRFTGASLVTDDNMLPPNLRGYAPEVTGVAKTNAKVTVSQQGRVLYETTVASGPFRIQDLNTAVNGKLDVKVTEQDGSVQTFQVDTASVPYLTRPGMVRYKFATGKPSDFAHHSQGPLFGTGEFSWGINNGWSMYGGALLAGAYNALALGIGRDLLAFGALSFDVTQSRAQFPRDATQSGGSYRLSYSKRFDEYDSQVTFAGYRFSERNFMSMSQYLDARYRGMTNGSGKELYTITFNKQFQELGLSAYVNYSHQTYWDRPNNDTYNLSLSRYFDVGRFKNVSLSLTAFRTKFNNTNDDGLYLSLAVPWGQSGTLSYDSQLGRGQNTNTLGYYDRLDDNNSYNVKAGVGNGGRATGSGYFTHEGDVAEITANASFQGSEYSAMGLSMQGGMTATAKGGALHRINSMGGTRMMVDTDGVSGVPVRGYGGVTYTNRFGKAVIGDVNSYYRNSLDVDLNKLPDTVEATRSVVQGTLTEGAIGYRKFGVIAGNKAMAVIKLADGSTPPFGAVVLNKSRAQVGIVNDSGSVWLAGINPGAEMNVQWNDRTQCVVRLPAPLPKDLTTKQLLLPCHSVAIASPATLGETS